MRASIVLTIAFIALLHSASSAQDPPAEDIQKRAEALLEKARHLSDIRSPNAPAFTLKATFSFTGTDLETVEGTYTEVWMSSSQWRRETLARDFHRIEVAGPATIWRLDNTDDFPARAAQLPSVVEMFPSNSASFAFESIANHLETDPPSECAITKRDSRHLRSAFCFDPKNGVLLEKIFPEVRPRNTVGHSDSYDSFRKFGDFWVPRHMVLFEDKHKLVEVNVVDLAPDPSPDPALFAPPPGATEHARCLGKLQYPTAISAPSATLPFGFGDELVTVVLSLLVDTKGKPQNVRVLRPGKKRYDESALSTVRSWRFKPATCDGEPMPTTINVQVGFRSY